MLSKLVRRVVGVEDAPKWLEKEVLEVMDRGLDMESAVAYLGPKIADIFRANVAKFRPGRAAIRKAAAFLTAEMVERLGFGVEFVNLFGVTLPAAVRGERRYTPILPLFDNKRKTLYLAAKSKRFMESVVQITIAEGMEGVLAEVIKLDKPPFYYLYTQADLSRMILNSVPVTAEVNKRLKTLYYYWRWFRERGYLALVGKELGGVAVDLLAIGLGRYAVVAGGSDRKLARLKKYVDGLYLA